MSQEEILYDATLVSNNVVQLSIKGNLMKIVPYETSEELTEGMSLLNGTYLVEWQS